MTLEWGHSMRCGPSGEDAGALGVLSEICRLSLASHYNTSQRGRASKSDGTLLTQALVLLLLDSASPFLTLSFIDCGDRPGSPVTPTYAPFSSFQVYSRGEWEWELGSRLAGRR